MSNTGSAAKAADGAAMVAFALALGVLAPALYRLPALHSDPGVLTVGVLVPVVVAYAVHAVLSGSPADPAAVGVVVGFDLLWWAVSAVFWPDNWRAVTRPAVAVPLAIHLLAAIGVTLAVLAWRRAHPHRRRGLARNPTRRVRTPVNRRYPAAAALDRSKPGPDGFPRPDYARARGLERGDVLAAETRRFTGRAPGDRLAELLNVALGQAEMGRHAEAVATLGQALGDFDERVSNQPAGYNHLYPLQSGAVIAVVRQAESLRALGRPDDALKCFEFAYRRFRSAMEEQAGEEDWYARQWAAEAQLRRGDLLADLGRGDEAAVVWRTLLPSREGFVWTSMLDWADEAADRLR